MGAAASVRTCGAGLPQLSSAECRQSAELCVRGTGGRESWPDGRRARVLTDGPGGQGDLRGERWDTEEVGGG